MTGYRAVIRALRKKAEGEAMEIDTAEDEEGFFGKCSFCGELKFDLIRDPESGNCDCAYCWDCREGEDEEDWDQ